MARRSVGGGQNALMRSSRSHGTRSGPERTRSSSTGTSVAPTPKASHVSSMLESYALLEHCATRSPGPRPNCMTSERTRLATPACSIITPFGAPVVPLV